jgi:hypothetical protein
MTRRLVETAWVPPVAAAALLGTTGSWVADTARLLNLSKEEREYDGRLRLCYALGPLHAHWQLHGFQGQPEFLTLRQVSDYFGISRTTALTALRRHHVYPLDTRIPCVGGMASIYRTKEVLRELEPVYLPFVEGYTVKRLALLMDRSTDWIESRLLDIRATPTIGRWAENGLPAVIYPLTVRPQLQAINQEERMTPPAGDWLLREHILAKKALIGRGERWCDSRLAFPRFAALKEPRLDDAGRVRPHWPPSIIKLLAEQSNAENTAADTRRAS